MVSGLCSLQVSPDRGLRAGAARSRRGEGYQYDAPLELPFPFEGEWPLRIVEEFSNVALRQILTMSGNTNRTYQIDLCLGRPGELDGGGAESAVLSPGSAVHHLARMSRQRVLAVNPVCPPRPAGSPSPPHRCERSSEPAHDLANSSEPTILRISQKPRYPSRPVPILYSGRRIMVMTGNVPKWLVGGTGGSATVPVAPAGVPPTNSGRLVLPQTGRSGWGPVWRAGRTPGRARRTRSPRRTASFRPSQPNIFANSAESPLSVPPNSDFI